MSFSTVCFVNKSKNFRNSVQNRLTWKVASISNSSRTGQLCSKLSLSDGPTTAKTLAAQFVGEGSTLTGCDFELVGYGYRLSLVKKRFLSGINNN